MARRIVLGVTIAILGVAGVADTSRARTPVTAEAACSILTQRMGKFDHIRNPNTFWSCDTLPDEPDRPDFYVIGLRSHQIREGIFSNLRGWYAVRKSTGKIYEYDMGELKVRPMGYWEALTAKRNSN
jgi:hypothetical protein